MHYLGENNMAQSTLLEVTVLDGDHHVRFQFTQQDLLKYCKDKVVETTNVAPAVINFASVQHISVITP